MVERHKELEPTKGVRERIFEGAQAEWAHFSFMGLMGQWSPNGEVELPTCWSLGEDEGLVGLIRDPETGCLELVVMEIKDRERLLDGSTRMKKVRIFGKPGIVKFVGSQVDEALAATEERGVLEAVRERKFPSGWFSGADWLSENVGR